MLRLLTYNILEGGRGREGLILDVIQAVQPDVVLLQEVDDPAFLSRLARELNMQSYHAEANVRLIRVKPGFKLGRRSLGLLSRFPIRAASTYRQFPVSRAMLAAQIEYKPGQHLAVFGVHLAAGMTLPSEFGRSREIKAILRQIEACKADLCIVAGDFNTVAAGDSVLVSRYPLRLKIVVRLQLGTVVRLVTPQMLAAGFTDCFRALHPGVDGFTLPPPTPNTRLDYIFASPPLTANLQRCEVVQTPDSVHRASDHYPVVVEFDL